MKIKTPNITGKTAPEQLKQVISYLRQLSQELNWALQGSGQVSQEDIEAVKKQVSTLSEQVEQLAKRLQEHIKGG